MMTRILIVEDNPTLAEGLRNNLQFEGYTVEMAATGEAALAILGEFPPDLVVLDLMLPGMDGFEVLRRIRSGGSEVPVLILSARGEEVDHLRGFRLGADDYVTKPFRLMELMARIAALLRRARQPVSAPSGPSVVEFRGVRIDARTRTVERHGTPVPLRPKEYDLLLALVRRSGAVVSRQELLDEVWGYDADVISRTVDTHILELRRKLEDDPAAPQHILTIRKTGYRLRL